MGCGASSSSGKKKKDKLSFEMKITKIPEYDSVFQAVGEPLQTLLEANETLKKGKRELERFTGTRKRLKDSTLTDTVMGMLYCYSASCNGEFTQLEYRVHKSLPYINVNRSSLRDEYRRIPAAFDYFVEKLIKVPEKLEPLLGQIKEAVEKSAGLSVFEIPEAISNTLGNIGRLSKAPTLLHETVESAKDLLKSLNQVVEMLTSNRSITEEIERVGKKAHGANVFNPEDIVTQFWPDQSRVLPPPPKK